jgi:hypothetical protein
MCQSSPAWIILGKTIGCQSALGKENARRKSRASVPQRSPVHRKNSSMVRKSRCTVGLRGGFDDAG